MAWHALIFSFRYLLTAPTHFYILIQTKLLGCSWRWYASRGSIVAAHCGNHINMNTDPTFLNFTCAQYRMRNLAWWVQIMCTGLVASLVTDRHTITLRLKIYYIEWWNQKISNDHWLLDSAMCAAPFDSFAMKWSCTLDPSEMLLLQQLVATSQVLQIAESECTCPKDPLRYSFVAN